MLTEFFGDRITSKGLWPPRSPELTSLTFVWSSIKEHVYQNIPRSINQQEMNAENIIRSNRTNSYTSCRNMDKRTDACIENNREHFQHVL
jgi:hypothetical protein